MTTPTVASERAPPTLWADAPAPDAVALARGRRALMAALAAWALLVLLAVPMGIGGSWRETDTQAIARNLAFEDFDLLRPRVDWRGDTDGAVECEFPLYQAAIALAMRAFGESEVPGRLLSLASMLVAAWALHRLLEARAGPVGALAGACAFLAGGHAFLFGARVMPDAFSTAWALLGLLAFVRYLGSGRGGALAAATLCTALACLTKPTALQVGMLQFLWAALLAPRRLRDLRLWLSWGLVLAVVAGWLAHAVALHAETGLTFGVVSGGETKFPTLRSLHNLDHWLSLALTTLRYGLAWSGALALVVLAVRRRLDRADLALLLTVGCGLVGTLRYSVHWGIGPHYHVFAAVAGAWLVGRAWPLVAGRTLRIAFVVALAATAVAQLVDERAQRQSCLAPGLDELGAVIREWTPGGERIVVRSYREGFDPYWRRRTNFEDPIVVYHARRHGFALAKDGFTPDALTPLRDRGARVVVDQTPDDTPAAAKLWLEFNSDAVRHVAGRKLYRLRSYRVR
ncbi:MAG: glycosyltransferase family 39 protein [Planctomycetes bacterium]|nr:glycosyltransferase family 39 protein [Planctomycetota bacterium]